MYSTTADRKRSAMLAGIAAAEHVATYGGRKVEVKINFSKIIWTFLAVVIFLGSFLTLAHRADMIAQDVTHCQTVLADGPSDAAEAVRCMAVIG